MIDLSGKKASGIANLVTIVTGISAIITAFIDWKIAVMILVLFIVALICKITILTDKSTIISVEGINIDCLNLVKPTFKNNSSLSPTEVSHICRIYDYNMDVTMHYKGFCKKKTGEDGITFNLCCDGHTPYNNLNCIAYDLNSDPNRKQKKIPMLISPDGSAKKVKMQFEKRLQYRDIFDVELSCTYPNCMSYGTDYYLSTLSFQNERLSKYTIKLQFEKDFPKDGIKVYKIDGAEAIFLKVIRDNNIDNGKAVYEDIIDDATTNSIRIYVFNR